MDGTGPMGAGAMTGRGMGACATDVPDYGAGYGGGRGCGNSRGKGFGKRCRYTAAAGNGSDIDDVDTLSRQARLLENQLDAVKKRIANMSDER
jgi:hypothetical protein